MSHGAFQRMHGRLLARLGEQATLQGVPCLVLIDHGVEIIGEYGQVSARVSTATLSCSLDPHIGQTLQVGAIGWLLDAQLSNDGFVAQYTLRRV